MLTCRCEKNGKAAGSHVQGFSLCASWPLSNRSWRTFWRRTLRSLTARARGCAVLMSTCRRRRISSTSTWRDPAFGFFPPAFHSLMRPTSIMPQDSKRNMLIEIMMVTAFVSLAILVYTTETGLFGAASSVACACFPRTLLTWALLCSHDDAQRGRQRRRCGQVCACSLQILRLLRHPAPN